MTTLEDPPVQTPTQAPVTQGGDLRSMLDAAATSTPNTDADFTATPQTPEKALDQPAKTEAKSEVKQKVAQKPAETSQKSSKPKTKWQGLEALKSPEDEQKEAPAAETRKPAGEPAKEVQLTKTEDGSQDEPLTRWRELRATEDKYKEIAPEYERLQKEIADLKGKPQIPEEVTKELEQLRQMYAVELLDTRPEFQQEVIAPMQEQLNSLKTVADHAGLDATQRQALRQAAENPDSFTRIRSIKQILAASTAVEDPEEVQTLVQFALEASGKYQEAKKREAGYIYKASEMANSVRGKEAQNTAKQQQERQAEYDTAHKEMIGTLETPLKPLFDDPEFGPELKDSLQSIRPAESPMDQAYQAQAGEILPFAIKKINGLLQRVSSLEKSLKAREGARPKTSDGTTPVAEQPSGNSGQDLKGLLNNMAR